MTRGTGQHHDLAAEDRTLLPEGSRPTPGPIAVLPRPNPVFVDAVLAGGGAVEPLNTETRGIVWLSEKQADELRVILDANPQVGWVQLPWAGVDAFADILSDYSSGRPLWTSAKGAYSEPVAEQAVALALALLRNFPEKSRGSSWEVDKRGSSIYGRHVVLVGAGGIAKEIIRLLSVFDVEVTVVRRSDAPLAGAARTVTADRLGEVLPAADVVILAAASTGETAQLIGERELRMMKESAVLVNIARGALIDTDALVDALRSGSVAGAGLDVTDPEPLPDGHPLWAEPRCLITSHSADTPAMTAPLLANRIRLNVTAFLGDGRFVGVVDPVAGY